MHFSAPFIRRPVATFLMSTAVLLAGAVAYTLLPVASLPQVEYPVISVGASLPGLIRRRWLRLWRRRWSGSLRRSPV